MTPYDMMNRLFDGYDITFTKETTPLYKCDCSKERTFKAVMSIGRKDIEEMIKEGEPIQVECHFCNQKYTFTPDELKKGLADS